MAARPDIVDIESCDLVGELTLDINSKIFPERNFNHNPPIICSTYFMKSDLILQIIFKQNPRNDMIEAFTDVLAGPRFSLTFKIKYGFHPFHNLPPNPHVFIYSPTNRRSEKFPVCPFSELLDFLVDNELRRNPESPEFIGKIQISLRGVRAGFSKYRIPTVNDAACDHRIICEGREIRVHKRLLMATSKFFYRRFVTNPLCTLTVIDTLDPPKRIEKETLATLLRFMYGLSISNHNLQTSNLLCAAREYEVNKLFAVCELTMIQQLSITMAPELFYIGKTERANKLVFEAAKFILAHYREVKETFEWKACIVAFPRVFEAIVPNPLKYFRGIVFPEVRSRSVNDVWTGATYLLRSPEIVLTRPVRDEPKTDPETETSSIAESRCSENTSRLSCDSLDTDFEPMPRKRSSPVISRRRSDSMSAFRMRSLDAALPNLLLPRVNLKSDLVATESKFEETFGPVESSTSDSSRSLSRSLSLPNDSEKISIGDNRKLHFYEPMDCRSDSNLTSTKSESKSPDSMGPGTLSGERPDLTSASPSLPSMRSLEFGFTYSYSSDSVFERRETPKSMSKVLTPAVDMSVSEIPSEQQHPSASPKAMKRIDFGVFTHPEARSLSDISSIPVDSSLSVEPESSTSSKSRSRREKRMKKTADKTRKFLPTTLSTNLPYDFSSSEDSSVLIPRPTFIKEYPTETVQFPSKFQQRKEVEEKKPASGAAGPSKSPSSSSPSASANRAPQRKVTFGKTDYIPNPSGEEQVNFIEDSELQETKYYQSWIEAASHYKILDVFDEATAPRVERQATDTEAAEKAWDEKDEEELTAPLLQKIGASTSGTKHKKFKKESPTSSSGSVSTELPLGGGVIRKAPGRFQTASVDDPTPLSSSESVGTTSSSLSSSDQNKSKRSFTDSCSSEIIYKSEEQPTIERGRSFVDLRTIRRSSQQQRNTPALTGVFSIGMHENTPQQPIENPTIEIFKDIESEKVEEQKSDDENSKPEADDGNQ